MRKDMAQVIIERPRIGHALPTKGKGYDRRNARLGWDDAVKREGMKVRGGGGKHLNENLAPLRRYLESNLGRPWEKVHADICEHLDRKNPVQDHVRDHLDDFVTDPVMVVDGQLVQAEGRFGTGWPIHTPYYVCPITGILKKTRRHPFRRCQPVELLPLDARTALVRRDGHWFVAHLEPVPAPVPQSARLPHAFDRFLKRDIDHFQAMKIYGQPVAIAHFHPARKSDVRRVVSSYPKTNLVRRK